MTSLKFFQKILNWFHFHGRKNLPWQIKKNPYKVWISEIMLQQTQVNTVIPYYKNFIKLLPNTKILSETSLDTILNIWSGLGYYARAKNIYKTSKILKEKFCNKLPNNFNDIIKLPGIGKSTAGAILSFGFNLYSCILDGNIKRVLIRYYGININDKKLEKLLWKKIQSLTPIHNTAKFNQACMDVGSLICKKSNPKCNICPLYNTCESFKNKQLLTIYHKKKIISITTKKTWFLIVQYHTRIFLEKQNDSKIWKNLFCFPKFSCQNKVSLWIKKYDIKINQTLALKNFQHALSNLKLYIIPIWIKINHHSIISKNNKLWYDLEKPQNIGLPKPIIKILNKIYL